MEGSSWQQKEQTERYSYDLSLRLGSRCAELPGVILSDISVLPNVQMILLGPKHSVFVRFGDGFQLTASLLVHKKQSILQ